MESGARNRETAIVASQPIYMESLMMSHDSPGIGNPLNATYGLCNAFCVILKCCSCKKSQCYGGKDPENKSHGQQGPGTENQPKHQNDNLRLNEDNTENATEDERFILPYKGKRP
ncbi:hypothetical protein ROHU_018034 [Labeo rohita]|uniref:Uncharacterized protein n=1 Tax=Labeo rohita TaxID=84645 RepID=A0A498NA66_LABRO|nr:hypothetical protein ROHU_018034 [Labeo rohita]